MLKCCLIVKLMNKWIITVRIRVFFVILIRIAIKTVDLAKIETIEAQVNAEANQNNKSGKKITIKTCLYQALNKLLYLLIKS